MRARLAVAPAKDGAPAAATPAGVDAAAAERLAALGYVGGGFFAGQAVGRRPQGQGRRVPGVPARHPPRPAALPRSRPRRSDPPPGPPVGSRSAGGHGRPGAALVQRRVLPGPEPGGEGALCGSGAAPGRRARDGPDLRPRPRVPGPGLGRGAPSGRRARGDRQGPQQGPGQPRAAPGPGRPPPPARGPSGARAALERARARDPASVSLRVDLATVYRNQGALEPARAMVEEALKLEPRSPQALVEKALVLGALGNEVEAAQALRMALQAAPSHADALYYLSCDRAAGRTRAGGGAAAGTARSRRTRVSRWPAGPDRGPGRGGRRKGGGVRREAGGLLPSSHPRPRKGDGGRSRPAGPGRGRLRRPRARVLRRPDGIPRRRPGPRCRHGTWPSRWAPPPWPSNPAARAT